VAYSLTRGGKWYVVCPKQPEGAYIASWLMLGSCAYQEERLGSFLYRRLPTLIERSHDNTLGVVMQLIAFWNIPHETKAHQGTL